MKKAWVFVIQWIYQLKPFQSFESDFLKLHYGAETTEIRGLDTN